MSAKHMRWPGFVVTVSGSGQFPIDMLRYDSAHPRTEQDAGQIQQERGKRTVQVVMPHEPCRPRWESFCWHVTNVEEIR